MNRKVTLTETCAILVRSPSHPPGTQVRRPRGGHLVRRGCPVRDGDGENAFPRGECKRDVGYHPREGAVLPQAAIPGDNGEASGGVPARVCRRVPLRCGSCVGGRAERCMYTKTLLRVRPLQLPLFLLADGCIVCSLGQHIARFGCAIGYCQTFQ